MRCDGCKYWTRNADGCQAKPVPGNRQVPEGFGHCARPLPYWDATEWVKTGDGEADLRLMEEHKDRKFFAQDGSDYHAVVITREDFFCAEYEAKA